MAASKAAETGSRLQELWSDLPSSRAKCCRAVGVGFFALLPVRPESGQDSRCESFGSSLEPERWSRDPSPLTERSSSSLGVIGDLKPPEWQASTHRVPFSVLGWSQPGVEPAISQSDCRQAATRPLSHSLVSDRQTFQATTSLDFTAQRWRNGIKF